MSPIGQQKSELLAAAPRRDLAAALAMATAAGAAMLAMRGFVVDDAWIPVRYARHLAEGLGYVWNVGEPPSDGVTPLPYAALLSGLAHHASPEVVLMRARLLGAAAWLAASGALGVAFARARAALVVRLVAGAIVALSLPIAAHAVSGLETGLVMALATAASVSLALGGDAPRARALTVLLASLPAAFRPEMAAWTFAIAVGASLVGRRTTDPRVLLGSAALGALALVPWASTFAIRAAIFGAPTPLSLLAKPSDLTHGLTYVAAAGLAALTPVLACAPLAASRAGGPGAVLLATGAAHLLAVAAAGGDWMPYARLVAPIAPSLALGAVLVDPCAGGIARGARAAAGLGLGVWLFVTAAPAGRRVLAERTALAEVSRPWLAHAGAIATVDIGWPSSVSEGPIVDLAGLTDPVIARLAGGHTSKRIDPALLLDRAPDTLLFFAKGTRLEEARYAHVVEARLAASDIVRAHFAPRAFLPLGDGVGYVVWKREVR